MVKTRRLFSGLALLICLLAGGAPAAGSTGQVDIVHSAYLVLAQEDSWKWSPAVAYDPNHNQYLVVWENWWPNGHHDIYGRTGRRLRRAFREFAIYSGVYNSKQPAVAYDTTHDQYLVAWSYDSAGDDTDYDIYGRFIPWNGPSPLIPGVSVLMPGRKARPSPGWLMA